MHQDCIFLQWTALNPKASVQGLHCRTQRGSRGNRCTRTPSPAPMQNRVLVKVGVAGGAVYVAYDEGMLGSGEKGSEVLRKAKAAIPPAVDEWMKYFGWELPAPPQIEFSPSQAWNSDASF
ncbi:MICOS complex subunit MIC13-like isoform X2 [Polyodon spathula]|uniref:MICOS complex subunit MIC13-like isoform X2 n=1 Tax=Polyodon spathula TaxID=7913 RepID=UPI001B7E3977|nr:MICOS complex subunit MIC13-like isoform X2 [Polyodon spathula]